MHDLHAASLVELARRVRVGALTSVALVDAHIERIEQVNPRLNAMVADRFDAARAEARAADAATRSGAPLGPFHGVPITIKEYIAVAGMPQTGGIVARAGHRSTADATVVARMRAAGAIVLGVTNAPEGGLWLETYNRVYGRTNHPSDPGRTSGGSSGGEAALVAAGASPLGLGSDTAGSIRLPCMFCGVPGHKPTGGLVPNTGQFPAPSTEAMGRAMVVGPIARFVGDLMPALRVIAGPDGIDPATRPWTLGDPDAVSLPSVRGYEVVRHRGVRVAPSMVGAVRRAGSALADAGAAVQVLDLPELATGFLMWAEMLTAISVEDYADIVGHGSRMRVRRQIVPWLLRRSPHTAPVLLVSALENLFHKLPERAPAFARKGEELRDRLADLLGSDGVILHPTYSRPAPRHRTPMLTPLDFVCTSLYSLFGFPVTQVPVGVDARGLPVGVQVVGAPGNDHLTLAVAAEIERRWPRRDTPPIDPAR